MKRMHRFKTSHSAKAARSVHSFPTTAKCVDVKRLPVLPPSPAPVDVVLTKNESFYITDVWQLFPQRKKNFVAESAMTPPSTPSSPHVEEQIEFLHNS
ncbi:unnamed protein product [Caenorhabditis auriculariae]|uniref:Uncharacterized protein n=1 Tax=Caenorhabditis auriculariae TaxID=2777116 RepID=A0A8S1H7G4_9PELO|nr:unnamed protein product [Caenorhabditis auriculariae]